MLRKEYISQIWEFFGWNANTTLKAFTEQKFWKTSLNDNENVNIVKHFSSYVLHIVFWVMISFLKFCSHIHAYMEYIHVGHHRISLKKTHSLQYTIKDCILFWFLKEEEFELAAVKTDHAYGTREDEPIIAPIDLDHRREEEQRIKMSWVNMSNPL